MTRHPITRAGGRAFTIATIPNATQSEVWVGVQRTINGVTKRYFEVIENEFDGSDLDAQPFFVDCGLSLDAINADTAKTITMNGASYAPGATVGLAAAGHTPFVVGDVGKTFLLSAPVYDDAGLNLERYDQVTVQVTAYTDSTHVSAKLIGRPATTLQNVALWRWARMVTSVSGADHLEGKTVKILADNAKHPDAIVTAGSVALNRPAARVALGLGYRFAGTTMDLEAGGADGPSQGKKKRIHRALLRLFESLGGRLGRPAELKDLPMRTTADPMGQAVPWFNADYMIDFPGDWDGPAELAWQHDDPLPFNVTAAIAQLVTNDYSGS